eukprot:scaffold23334_cov33-Phaeocystis_antarctica.AAC.1
MGQGLGLGVRPRARARARARVRARARARARARVGARVSFQVTLLLYRALVAASLRAAPTCAPRRRGHAAERIAVLGQVVANRTWLGLGLGL